PIKKRRLDSNGMSSGSLLSPAASSSPAAPNRTRGVEVNATSETNAPKIANKSSVLSRAALPTPVASSQVDAMEPQSKPP
ncbi:MAG: hypothetical protein Q9191_008127, partial [Dirinaria sp. TL-2023a]